MRNEDVIRARYLRDDLPVRLGNLAANLARISSFAESQGTDGLVEGLLSESEHFIEWTAVEAPPETQSVLVELQVVLARWLHGWKRISNEPILRSEVSRAAQDWSDRILSMSGLLDQPETVREKRT